MKQDKITATANPNKNNDLKESRSCEFEIPVPETTEEAVATYGEKVVFSTFMEQLVIKAQGTARRRLEKGNTAEQVQAYFNNVNVGEPEKEVKPWKPGIVAAKKSRVDKLVDNSADLSDDEFEAYLKKVREQRRAAKTTTA